MRGRDPRGPGSIPGVHPKGGLFMVRQAARKAAASALGVRISPRPLASMVQRIGRQFPELEIGGSTPPGSAHGTDLAGAHAVDGRDGAPRHCVELIASTQLCGDFTEKVDLQPTYQ